MSLTSRIFCRPIDGPVATVTVDHQIGSNAIQVDRVDLIGTVSPAAPVRLTALDSQSNILAQFKVSEINGITLTVVADDYPDAVVPAGTILACTPSRAAFLDIYGWIADATACLTGLGPLAMLTPFGTPSAATYLRGDGAWAPLPAAVVTSVAGKTGAVVLGVADVNGLGSIATHAASDYLTPTGDGSGLTGLAGSQINGPIAGRAGSVATIAGLITAGSNVTITGSGTSGSPFVITASGGGGGSATPGGSSGQFQYNNGGAFAGAPLTTDGTDLTATGNLSAGGFSASHGYTGCEHLGAGATSAGGPNNTAIGAGAVGSNATFQANNTVIGAGAVSNHAGNTVVGAQSKAYGESSVLIGANLVSSANGCNLIGANLSSSNAARGAIGAFSTVSHPGAFAIGWGLGSNFPDEFIFGGRDRAGIVPRFRLSGSTTIYSAADLLGLITEFADATPGSHKGRVHFGACDSNDLRVVLSCEADGSAAKFAAFGASPVNQPTVTGSRSNGDALNSFLQAMAQLGWIINNTTP